MGLSEETDGGGSLQRFERVRDSAFLLFSDSDCSQRCSLLVFLRFIALEALRLVLLILEICSMISVASRAVLLDIYISI